MEMGVNAPNTWTYLSSDSLEKCMSSNLKMMPQNKWTKSEWCPVRFSSRP